jgi:signal transduction histidine kinase
LNLRLKFILILILFCVGVGVNVSAAIWANSVLLARATVAFQAADDAASSLESLRNTLSLQRAALQSMVDTDLVHREGLREIAHWSGVLRGATQRLTATGLEGGLSARTQRLKSELDEHLHQVEQAMDQQVPGTPPRDAAHLQSVLIPGYRHLNDELQVMAGAMVRARHQAAGSMSENSEEVSIILVLMAVVEFIVVMVLLSLFRRWIIEPIGHISVATEQIAAGNLDYRMQHGRNDELGALAVQVNHMAESLARAQREAQQSARMAAVGEMVSVVAHNIRNPLAGIRATAQACLPEMQAGSQLRTLQQRIIDSVDTLEQWLKQLLHLNRPLQLTVEPTSLDDLVADLKKTFEPTLQRHAVELLYKPVRQRLIIDVDRQHFVQAMAAIIDNAIEASPAGSEVVLRAEPVADRFRIDISDSGAGVPYFTTKPGGTGIGLSMAKKIIEAHRGELSVVRNGQSGHRGATFRIELNAPATAKGRSAVHG